MLEHGGKLLHAAQHYGVPVQDWLDLSTGINFEAWSGITPSAQSWNRLPQEEDGLIDAARACYGAPHVLPVPGSQAALQVLPRLRTASRVGIVAPAYEEHAYRWRQAGHSVELLAPDDWSRALDRLEVLVLCNPNNPTGERTAPARLLDAHARLAARNGWLLVDEAFVDAAPHLSLAAESGREGLIVLRSLGKFFGLAGARVGFVLAAPSLLAQITEWFGPWSIAGPSREIAIAALRDLGWQTAARRQLRERAQRLAALLDRHELTPAGGCELFQWIRTPQAARIHAELARSGILTRLFADPPSLRLGIPARGEEWQRLESALADLIRLESTA